MPGAAGAEELAVDRGQHRLTPLVRKRLLDLQVAGRSSKTIGWYEQKIRYYLQSVVSARAGFPLPQARWPPTSSRSRRLG